MAKIILSEMDDVLVKEISDLASQHKRSLEEEVVDLLRDAVLGHKKRLHLVAVASEIAGLTPDNITQTDSVELLREDRDR